MLIVDITCEEVIIIIIRVSITITITIGIGISSDDDERFERVAMADIRRVG